ncbi:MAG: hypothetical protein IPH45_19110 [Bacteroidales bacterium]|nr:hypothetical protein [Bacteroidales bacterium]
MAAGSLGIVSFTGWNPPSWKMCTSVRQSGNWRENLTSNNTKTILCNVNNNLYSYCYSTTGPSGFGFTYPEPGIFASKFTMNGTGMITGSNLVIANYAANTGNTVYAVVMDNAGTIVAQSANHVILATELGTNVNFTFPTPPVFTDEQFYVGLAQTAGTVQWYPMGTFPESPLRNNTFYTAYITGGTPAPLIDFNVKYGIEALVEAVPVAKVLNLTSLFLQGRYMGSGMMHEAMDEFGPHWGVGIADHITVELHNATSPYALVYTASEVVLSTSGVASITVPETFNGSYYIYIRHRNSIEIATSAPVSFAGGTINYSFDSPAKVYGSNLRNELDGMYSMYGGDANQDGLIDAGDMVAVDNLNLVFATGWFPEDADVNGMIDASDMMIVDNNNSLFIASMLP